MTPSRWLAGIVGLFVLTLAAQAQSFSKDVQPFFNRYCVDCHSGKKAKAGVRLDTYDNLKASKRKILVPGQPDESLLVTSVEGTDGEKMPPKKASPQPNAKEISMLRTWVAAGAKNDAAAKSAVDDPASPQSPVPVSFQADAKLKAGDRIVFLGDSITAAGNNGKGYINLIRAHLAEKKPDLKIESIGAGISGNKVPDLQRRLEKDVVAKMPTLVVIYIGINDVWHGEKDPKRGTSPEVFEAGLNEIIDKLQKVGSKVVLCTPTVIGEKNAGANPLDAKLDQYADISRKVAREQNIPLCDLRKAFVDHLASNNAKNADRGVLTGDRVHLNEAGNRLVADTMLKTLGEN